MSLSPFTVAFARVWGTLNESTKGYGYLFTNEKVELTLALMAQLEEVYDEAFADCEEQDSGFAGSTAWTNNNPYRKDDNVLDIIAKLQRTLR